MSVRRHERMGRLALLLFPTLFIMPLDHDLLGWNPFLQLGAGHGEASYAMAMAKIAGWSELSGSLLYHFSPDAETEKFFGSVFSQLNNFDLSGVYGMIPGERTPEGWKAITFEGRQEGAAYVLRTHAAQEGMRPTGSFTERGAFASQVRIRPARMDPETFLGDLHLKVGLADTTTDQLLALAQEVLAIFEQARNPENLEGLLWAKPLVAAEFPKLEEEDLRTLLLLERSFPTIFHTNKKLFDLQDVVHYEREEGGRAYTRLCLDVSLRRKEFGYKYPRFADYLDRVEELLDVRFVLKDEEHRPLVTAEYKTSDFSMRWNALIADGGLLPMSASGKPAGRDPISPTELSRMRFEVEVTLSSNFSGLKVDVEEMVFHGELTREPKRLVVTTTFDEKPKVSKVSGRAYGLVPSWLIDVFIPSNIDTLIDDFLGVITEGNGGRGLETRWVFSSFSPDRNVLEMRGTSEILDNTFVQIGFRLFNKRLMPDDEVLAEIIRLLRTNYAAFQKDFARFKERTAKFAKSQVL